MSERVSVVIPTYNRAHLIARTVHNVLSQTHEDVLAIVLDDGSCDDTAHVMRAFASNERVLYVKQENGGVSSARNHALRLVQGEFVAFLDSDDQWVSWKLAAQLAVMRALPEVGMVWTDMDMVDEHDELQVARCMRSAYSTYGLVPMRLIVPEMAAFSTLAPNVVGPPDRTQVRWGDAFSALALGNICQPSTVLVRRSVAEAAGPWNEAMRTGEDHDYHLRLAREAKVAILDCATVRYRKGAEDQLTRPELQLTIAENYLKTILPVFEHERERIQLPPRLLRRTLASAHAWLAEELTKHGRKAEARVHYAKSLLSWPLQGRTAMMLALSMAPERLTERARVAYRTAKSVVSARR
ncbi:MAG: glycosyltransferase family 2 protein [Polyangia bacterium]